MGRVAAKDRRPPVEPFGWLVDAFWQLSTARSVMMGGIGPIPLPVIWAYADRHDCPLWFDDVLQALDMDYLTRGPAEKAAGDG